MLLPRYLDLETISTCNRVCPTCIRNSHPNRDAIKSWFEVHYMPIPLIKQALEQAIDMGFTGGICLSHFNEPLMDERMPEIAELARSYKEFSIVFLNSDGDFLTEELANKLDGKLDRIIVSLYMKEPVKSQRAEWIKTLFKKTECIPITESDHIPSHFSPKFDVKALAEKYRENDCKEPATRIIINHRQQYLLCCEDVIGNFDLGTFPETSLKDYWFGTRHTFIHDTLLNRGGRNWHSYCAMCPKT